ncbi:hypothetical protein RSAG8_08318, partial [Rhizoctonia solani AG-8 WAC10335]
MTSLSASRRLVPPSNSSKLSLLIPN